MAAAAAATTTTDRPTGPQIWCQELARDLGGVTRGPPEYARVGFNQSLPPRTPELEATLTEDEGRISLRTFFNVSVMMPIVRGYTSRCGAM